MSHVIAKFIRLLRYARKGVYFAGANAVWGRVDKQSLENCMNNIALALSLVMAGTGDLQTLGLLRGSLYLLQAQVFAGKLMPSVKLSLFMCKRSAGMW